MERHIQNLIRADYERMERRERLAADAKVEKYLFIQAIEGHAHNGHGEFRQQRYVDVNVADVVKALGMDPKKIKRGRQQLIDAVEAWLRAAAAGKAPSSLVDADGKPLLTIPFFKDLKVDPVEVAHGFYLGGRRDDSEVRARVEKDRHIPIGGGACYIVDTQVMRALDLDAEKLSHGPHADEIPSFRSQGLIVDIPADQVDDDRYRFYYIRDRVGPGHSDDAAMVFAGMLWGTSCALGVFLADAVDTIEKYSEKYVDQDDLLAVLAREAPFFKPEWDRDLYELTALAAEPPDREYDVPDSSMRYFLRLDPDVNRCALQNHLEFINGRPTAAMSLGFDRVMSTRFYRYVRERMLAYEGRVAAAAPAGTLGSLAGVVDRSFLRVNIGDPVEKVLEAFAASDADVAIVVDDAGAVVGTVRARDLLKLTWGYRRS